MVLTSHRPFCHQNPKGGFCEVYKQALWLYWIQINKKKFVYPFEMSSSLSIWRNTEAHVSAVQFIPKIGLAFICRSMAQMQKLKLKHWYFLNGRELWSRNRKGNFLLQYLAVLAGNMASKNLSNVLSFWIFSLPAL